MESTERMDGNRAHPMPQTLEIVHKESATWGLEWSE
jgi:hypothetical protein